MLALFITKWDIELLDPEASRSFSWRTFIYPFASTKVNLRPRERELASENQVE